MQVSNQGHEQSSVGEYEQSSDGEYKQSSDGEQVRASIDVLPDDVLLLVIKKLTLPNLYSLGQVNRRLRALVFSTNQRKTDHIDLVTSTRDYIIIANIVKDFPKIRFDLISLSRDIGCYSPSIVAFYPKNFWGVALGASREATLFALSPAFREMIHVGFTTGFNVAWLISKRGINCLRHLHTIIFHYVTLEIVDLNVIDKSTRVTFRCCNGTTDIQQIASVEYLRFVSCPDIKNWQYLGAQKTIIIKDCDIADVSNLCSIRCVELNDCPNVKDISALADVPELKIINCPNVRDFSVLGKQESLALDSPRIKDARQFANVKKLYLFHTGIVDVAPLANVHTLHLKSTIVRDITPLYHIPELNIAILSESLDSCKLFPGVKWEKATIYTITYNRPLTGSTGVIGSPRL